MILISSNMRSNPSATGAASFSRQPRTIWMPTPQVRFAPVHGALDVVCDKPLQEAQCVRPFDLDDTAMGKKKGRPFHGY